MITIVGGGIAGLVAAISCRENGAPVRLLEARSELGGYARTTAGSYKANLGPHALYSDGPLWAWLRERDLLPPVARPPLGGLRFVDGGRLRRTLPPRAVAALVRPSRHRAPVDRDLRLWAAEEFGDRVATLLSNAAGVFAFDSDPGRLSAEFVWSRLVRVTRVPPAARYPIGGWAALVQRLGERAHELGVEIETGAEVSELPPAPVIVATGLSEAAEMLGDTELTWEGGHAVCLDLGLRRRKGDPFIVSGLDRPGWVERFSRSDRSLAPRGEDLVQAQIGVGPEEAVDRAAGRLEEMLDLSFEGWRDRVTWRRRQVMQGRTAALDLPGHTWRDRPAIARGDGVFVAGDHMAAKGLLSEVSWASAIEAAQGAVAAHSGVLSRQAG